MLTSRSGREHRETGRPATALRCFLAAGFDALPPLAVECLRHECDIGAFAFVATAARGEDRGGGQDYADGSGHKAIIGSNR